MNKFGSRLLMAFFLVIGWATGLAGEPTLGKEEQACLECHGQPDFAKDGPGGRISLHVDGRRFANSLHGAIGCTGCHGDVSLETHPDKPAAPANCAQCHDKADVTYRASVHGLARKAGNAKAATCSDCHGAHDIGPMNADASPLSRRNLEDTCGKCHAGIVQEVKSSVHGQAMARGEREAPTCTDCHGDHTVEGLRKATSMKIAQQVCSRCHASQRMNAKYGIPEDRVSTFFDSYHGLAARMGSTSAANCSSCHGYHGIYPSSDPRSSVHPNNMVATCARCHPGAGEKFAQGRVHAGVESVTDIGARASHWVKVLYLILIFGTIGTMLAHNLLAFRRKLILSLRDPSRNIQRMGRYNRIQHLLLVISFSYLAISGFALRFPDSWLVWMVGSNENFRRIGHRSAAVVLMSLALAHAIYIFGTQEGRRYLKDMLPRRSDLRHVMENLHHYLRLEAPRPKFSRFWYAEKAEYWALIWGSLIMSVTGLLIWCKIFFTTWFPRWIIELSITIHFYEAVLACLAIFVWHFYFVIFDPDVYPINWAWFDGRISDDHHAAEHHREEAEAKARAAEDSSSEDPPGLA